jgi:cell division transport system ATP-binding protein
MIQTINVSLSYNNGVQALRNVSVRIGKGEFVFIVGTTGSGKSSFIKLLNREEVPTSGQVLVAGRDVVRMRPRHVPMFRRSVGVVFQDFRLLPERTVSENVAFALHVIGAPGKEIRRRTSASLELVNLSAKADAYPHEISGGEQQRASIDPDTSWDIMSVLDKINGKGTTVIVASHDKVIVDRLQKRVIEFDHGKVVRDEQEGRYGAEADEAPLWTPGARDWHLKTLLKGDS